MLLDMVILQKAGDKFEKILFVLTGIFYPVALAFVLVTRL